MRDYLLDIVEHTYDLGNIDLIKVNGTDKETTIKSISSDKTLVMSAKFTNPSEDFIGTFGMPNLNKLKSLLNLQEYREGASITLKKNKDGNPDGIRFENASGDFKNDYRFMQAATVDAALKVPKFNGANYNIEFEPSLTAIQRLKMQSQVASEDTFKISSDGDNLVFTFGDQATHAGNFVFQADVTGKLTRSWTFVAKTVISILSLRGDKTFYISNDGLIKITVDSGLAVYDYLLPGQTK